MKDKNIYNIIVAAGSGRRFGSDCPKQFQPLAGRPVLMHTIDRMRHALPDSDILLVLSKEHLKLWEGLCGKYGFHSPTIIIGGSTRWQSVKNAVDTIELAPDEEGIITVHDGARPLIDTALIKRIIDGLISASGSIPAIPVTDSLRMIEDNGASHPVDRSSIRAVQTPQAFDAHKLIKAYGLPYDSSFTDDASVMAAAGYTDIALVEGGIFNIKITMPADIDVATIYMAHETPTLA